MSVDFSQFINTLQSTITPAQILSILSVVVFVGIVFVIMWFGVRTIIQVYVGAFVKGRFNIK